MTLGASGEAETRKVGDRVVFARIWAARPRRGNVDVL